MKLNNHVHLVLRLKISGIMASCLLYTFMTFTGIVSTFMARAIKVRGRDPFLRLDYPNPVITKKVTPRYHNMDP